MGMHSNPIDLLPFLRLFCSIYTGGVPSGVRSQCAWPYEEVRLHCSFFPLLHRRESFQQLVVQA